ncbi:chemotaxis protein CheW [Ectothiorhodospiraceae bacterium BW-2]|nr:chemotaxis protein CheW [Ectothiorhodospiraceae bacterium BW-2]
MSQATAPQPLMEERQALSAYFDALLFEEPQRLTPTPETLEPAVAEPTSVVVAPPAIILPKVEAPVAAPTPVVETVTPVEEQGEAIPVWGESRFQALLFKVAGLTLAVPLVELSGVQEWEPEALTIMPGHIDWYLGIINHRGRRIPVIDTALFVLPENRKQRAKATQSERLQRIVYIDNNRWGLACDEVSDVISLEPQSIRWRSNRTSRKWLAGTVIEKMCAIIDPPSFAEMLASGIDRDELEQELHS